MKKISYMLIPGLITDKSINYSIDNSLAKFKDAFYKAYRINESLVLSNTRKRNVVKARHLLMYLIFCNFRDRNMSLAKIGQYLGGKDHATVLHAIKVVKNDRETDKLYAEDFDIIIEQMRETVNVKIEC